MSRHPVQQPSRCQPHAYCFWYNVSDCPDIPAIFERFALCRKDLTGPVTFRHELPFSASWAIQEEKYNALSWGAAGDAAPYNHAGGIHQSERVTLAAIADLSKERQDAFRQKWGLYFPETRAYDSIVTMCANEPLDTISVCVRGPHHFPVMMEVIASRPKAIPSTLLRTCFLEKPPTCSLQEMDTMVAAAVRLSAHDEARTAGVPITVSYSQHWAPSVARTIGSRPISTAVHGRPAPMKIGALCKRSASRGSRAF